MQRYRSVLIVTLGLSLLISGCGFGGSTAEVEEGVTVGKHLPDVALRTFADNTMYLHEMTGKPLIINFWATWCGPCREEIPLLQDAYTAHRSTGLQIIAITNETKDVVEPFIQDQGMTFPIMFDSGSKISNTYHIQGIPTTFFLDRDGVIIARHVGALGSTILASYLEDLLREPNRGPAPTEQPALPAPTSRPEPPQQLQPSPIPLEDRTGLRVNRSI